MIRVPRPGGLKTSSRPPIASMQHRPARKVGAADPVVGDLDPELAVPMGAVSGGGSGAPGGVEPPWTAAVTRGGFGELQLHRITDARAAPSGDQMV